MFQIRFLHSGISKLERQNVEIILAGNYKPSAGSYKSLAGNFKITLLAPSTKFQLIMW